MGALSCFVTKAFVIAILIKSISFLIHCAAALPIGAPERCQFGGPDHFVLARGGKRARWENSGWVAGSGAPE